MKKRVGLWKYLLSAVMLMLLCAAHALAFDVSGTVSYPSGVKSGKIVLQIITNNGMRGTVINAPGPFTIRGVEDSYGTQNYVHAFMDTQGTGVNHYTDPFGMSEPFTVSASGVSVPSLSVIISDPPSSPMIQAPIDLKVFPGSGGVMAMWEPPRTGLAELADSYTLYWGTNPNPGSGNSLGSKPGIISSGNNRVVFVTGLSDNSQLYFAVTATVNGTEGPSIATPAAIAIGAPVGGNAVNGSVDLSSAGNGTAPLYVALCDDSQNGPPAVCYISSVPSVSYPTTQNFSFSGVQNGIYRVYAVLDRNSNGQIDLGDLKPSELLASQVIVNGASVSGVTTSLNAANSHVLTMTNHWKGGTSVGFGLSFSFSDNVKAPVAFTLNSGLGLPYSPIDFVTFGNGDVYGWIGTGTTEPSGNYSLTVMYTDGTIENINGTVVGNIVDFANPVSPVDLQTYTDGKPVFTWSAPVNPPANYTYELEVTAVDGSSSWYSSKMPSSQRTAVYNFDNQLYVQPLSSINPTDYRWSIRVVDTATGNSSNSEVFFHYGTGSGDVIAPTTPTGVIATASLNQIDVSWNASTDNIGVSYYKVYRNGTLAGQPAGPFNTYWPDYPVAPNTTNFYTVSACDASGNCSAQSTSASATTPPASSGVGSITGNVLSSTTGASLASITVNMSGPANTFVMTDSTGSFSFPGLSAGMYTISVSASGYLNYSNPVQVNSNGVTTVPISLTPKTASFGDISGTISYSGSKTGRIFINVNTNNGNRYGTSITGPGAYIIRGVPTGSGSYTVNAYMDVLGVISPVVNSPNGSAFVSSTGVLSGVNITLMDPIPASPGQPTAVEATPGDSSVLIRWDGVRINGVEAADGYTIYWNTSASVSKTNFTGSRTVPAGIDSPAIIDGLTNGANYYFVVVPNAAGLSGPPSAVFGPVLIGAPTGGNTISGTVNYTGPTATGPLYVAVVKPQNKGLGSVFFTKIINPSPNQSFSVSGIPNGTYEVYTIYDMNNDKLFANGDVTNTDNSALVVTLTGAGSSGNVISLASSNSSVKITTQHGVVAGTTNDWYNIESRISNQLKTPVAVALTSAPSTSGLNLITDIGYDREFRFYGNVAVRPVINDTYTFTVTYSDGTTEVFSPQVTGVLDSYPTNPGISGTVSTVPTFTWGAPATTPPASYNYDLSVYGNNSWDVNSMPSTQFSVIYGFDGQAPILQVGTSYNWDVSVRDKNGNRASVQSTFTPTVAAVSISGSIKNVAGAGIANAYVGVYNSLTGSYRASNIADSNGNYVINDLPTGNYKLYFSASGFITQWYNNKNTVSTADPVVVTSGSVTLVGATILAQAGAITGTVTNSSGVGISGVIVRPYDAVSNAISNISGLTTVGMTTDANGNYMLSGMPAGSYKLNFEPNTSVITGYSAQWYNNKNSITVADPVVVTAGATTPAINATLILGGKISGTVTDSSGAGIANVNVSAYDAVTNSYVSGSGATSSTGTYTIQGLSSGNYKVLFTPLSSYIPQWFNNQSSITAGDTVTVTAGATTPLVNATLALAGKISGTVVSSAGSGMSGITVYAFNEDSNLQITSVVTSSTGTYTLSGLPTGNYKVRFNSTNSANNYVTVWNNSKPSIATADSIAVVAGITTVGVNATLAIGGSISGQLTDVSAGVTNINVNAYNLFDESVATAVTDTNGNYTIKGLPNGSYKLRFQELPNSSSYSAIGYVIQMYTNPNINAVYMSQGTLIPVTATTPVTGINAVLVKGVGSISGTVTGAATGAVLSGAGVQVTDLSGGFFGSANADANGNYTVKGLPTGSYKVELYMSGKYANQWYTGSGDFTSATSVTVTAPNDTPVTNVALGTGPSVRLQAVIKGYGNVNVTSTSSKILSVFNFGTSDLIIGTLTVTGADFSLLNDRCSGKTLPPSGSCTIQVSFAPTSVGAKSAIVNIPSNDPETSIIGMVVKGTGVSNDSTPPTVLSATPALNATNVSITPVLTVKFSEAIDGNTLPVETAFLKTSGGVYVVGVGVYDTATNTAAFTPAAPLAYNTTYTGTLSGIKDLAGNSMVGSYTFTFTTGTNPDSTAPTVILSTPQNNAANVSVDVVPSIKFSEPVKSATVQGALILRAGSVQVAGTVSFDPIANAASFTPSAPLAMGTTYTLSVGNAIEDLAGNKLNPFTIFFATEVPSGDIDGQNGVDIADAYKMLEIAIGRVSATPQDLKRADIAPLVNGKPKPDGVIDVADVVVVLRRIVGLVNW